ncbi:hypothetical protein [uncultured Desulfosarcina sp.]|uniref:hypothetical protein n=1 Tax=uncultured Desulfosarcina sp. TaxID=218289 RepID=UPI0029C60403|nr:hypothetical protein [uncultured Desulfosarcina sp.]
MKTFTALSLSAMLSSFAWFASGGDWSGMDYFTYRGTTDKAITASWDVVEGATYYEAKIYSVDHDYETNLGKTETNRIAIQIPRSGHYVFMVRACNDLMNPPCSEWTESTDPERASVDGKPRGWWVYGHVAPAGIPTITKEP